ncbi:MULTISPECIES: LpxA family transferase [unclassified Kaistella]|uniref:LpxA family transferase n=1 Tax=unclassified Kaistella TaxID=2762626 RepID=UPI0027332939|nr:MULTISPECIES: LpxA family transferase [unclassified Kaistella]MDP2454714.1 LpxA family transferase [Kaistella sp. SH11-4b]MDP2457451.1 LpxA family transferase [Kaistella sp. SH40-3]MDP2460211.1 LpxA family transferase [Kaistella sp. SH19-2b]
MVEIENYIENIKIKFPLTEDLQPWEIIDNLENILLQKIKVLDNNYKIENNIAIHKTAIIEQGVILKGTVIISENCFIGAHAYLRGPIFLSKSVKVGPSSEIKQSIIFDNAAIAHFNYIGNSIIGQNINFEAGSICANHYNERQNKNIWVTQNGTIIDTKTEEFGSLVGDNSKIGANAVLSPGTILEKCSIVKRLDLIEQTK